MPVKQIQLRGISRTPSDRMIADGGVAESLNVFIDNTESAPALQPNDITAAEGLPTDKKYDVLFIHKGNGYTNYICQAPTDARYRVMITDYEDADDVSRQADLIVDEWDHIMHGLTTDERWNMRHGLIDCEPDLMLPGSFATSAEAEAAWYDLEYALSYRGFQIGNADFPLESSKTGIGVWDNGEFKPFLSLAENEVFKGITAVGNTLVINTNSNIYFVLYETGDYDVLGTDVPMPKIKITAKDADIQDVLIDEYSEDKNSWGDSIYTKRLYDEQPKADPEVLSTTDLMNTAANRWTYNTDIDKEKKHYESIQDVINAITNKIKLQDGDNDAVGRYGYPVWATYGVHLYDDTVIFANPVLLDGIYEKPYSIIRRTLIPGESRSNLLIKRHHAYTIQYILESLPENWEKWKDLILSVEIYVSPMIGLDLQDARFARWRPLDDKYNGITKSYDQSYFYLSEYRTHYGEIVLASRKSDKGTSEDYLTRLKESMLYRLETFEYDTFTSTPQGIPYDIDSVKKTLTEYIVTQPALDMGTAMQMSDYNISMMSNLNQRLVAVTDGEVIKHNKLYHTLESFKNIEATAAAKYLDWYVLVAQTGGSIQYDTLSEKMVLPDTRVESDDNNYTVTYIYEVKTDKGLIRVKDNPIAFNGRDLVYAACVARRFAETKKIYAVLHKEVAGEMVYVGTHTYNAEELPSMFSVFNAEESRTHILNVGYEQIPIPETTVDYVKTNNALIVSNVNSVFTFNLANKYTFPSPIIGLGFVTKPLSQGQFGQFPLYVFTEGGIYAMEMNVEGTFVNQHMISREVAIPGTITSLEQGVLFATDKGLMSIVGSDVTNLSPDMNGKHYVLEESVAKALSRDDNWKDLVPILQDSTPFMDFVRTSGSMFDYANSRIIMVSSEDPGYHYLLKLDTNTWHKLSSDVVIKRILNSFPKAYAQVELADGTTALYDYSPELSNIKAQTGKGVIITRPFDLGETDVRKSINRLLVRGDFAKAHVQLILLGSMDGRKFTWIPARHGSSWKCFRAMLLLDLDKYERVSYLDIEYDSRFINKLR